MSRARAGILALLLFGLGAGGCGSDPGPRRLDLARAGAGVTEISAPPPLGDAGAGARVEQLGEDLWLVAPLERAAWRAAREPGRFHATLPVLAVGGPRGGGALYRLRAGERDYAFEPDPEKLGEVPGRFTTRASEGLRLELALAAAEAPPEHAELWAVLGCQSVEEGLQRVGGRRLSGSGWWVPSGQPRTLALALPPDSQLRFATSIEPLFGARELRQAEHVFRVRLDGALIFEQRLKPDVLGEGLEWHSVELPRGGVQKARLEFEVEGPLALSSFLAPCVGPRAFGTYAERPASLARGAQRDILVFLADTFRADNLAAYGSPLALTPEIDGFAKKARTYRNTWSTATHTLASHSAMFSGVFPHQNGQVDFYNPLPGEVRTLAELLTRAGYRCGLISDGVMVSHSHGLDQGFELCDERKESGTLARTQAFLEADDGRPIFLFVQTYAVHTPYEMSAETRARWNGPLHLDHDFAEVMSTPLMRAGKPLAREAPPEDAAAREIAARLHDLYRAGVTELDALFGRFHAELARRGLLAQGCLIFTSDHGEAFFEHGIPFHANRVFEEELRVPLLVALPGLAPGVEERPVSLIDFTPTVAELAGVEALPQWRGRSLLRPLEQRVLYAFQSNRSQAGGSTLAVIDGAHKWMGYDDLEALRAGRVHAAFDLARDPAELENVLGSAAWPEELARAQFKELEELLTPLVLQEHANLSPEKLQELRALGYDGSSEDEPSPK